MKKLLLSLVLALTVLSPLSAFGVNTAKAATVPVNTAIRGTTSSTVFWYANDGKRYVFPNAASYYTWFPSFDNVRMISDSELFAITIGGNVTYRPGAKLVKVNTDPRVYVVSRGGVLRHVTSEFLAERLFGADWRSDVHDIADVYFTNYTVGTPVYNESDYNVSTEYHGVTTPSDSLRGQTGTGSTGDLTLSASRTSINAGEAVTLSVFNTQNYSSGYRIEIYDTRTNGLIRTCNLPASTCETTVYPQRNGTEATVQYFAAIRDVNSMTVKSGYSPVIYFGGVLGQGATNTGTRFTTTVSRTTALNGESVTLTAELRSGYSLPSSYRIEIQDPRNSQIIQSCWNTTTCSTSINMTATGIVYNVNFQARLVDGNGSLIANEAFPMVSVNTSSNGTQFSSGSSSLEANRTTANAGESVTLTARAWNLNTTESNIRMELYRESNNSLVDTCYDRSTCTFNVTVSNDGSNAVRYYVIVKNDANEQIPAAYSNRITVSGTSTTTMALSASRTSVMSGEVITLTASGANSFNTSRIVFVNEQSGAIIANCYSVSSCSQTVTVTGYNGETIRYRAEARDWNGAILATSYVTVYVNSTGSQTGTLTLTADRTSVTTGQPVILYANYNGTLPSGGRLEIKRDRTNEIVGTCYNNTCTITVYPHAESGLTIDQYYVSVLNTSGNSVTGVQYGPIINLTGSSSGSGDNRINGLVLNADRTSINAGELVRLTANAYNSGTWSYTGNRMEISNVKTGQTLRTCYDVSTCTLDVYPQAYTSSDMTAQYQARIYDRNGVLAMSQYSPVIYLNGTSNGSNNGTSNGSLTGIGTVTFGPTENLRVNRTLYLTTTFTNSNLAMADAKVELYAEHLSTPIATCTGSYTCSVSYATGNAPMTTRVYARLSNRYNVSQWLETPRVSLTTTW